MQPFSAALRHVRSAFAVAAVRGLVVGALAFGLIVASGCGGSHGLRNDAGSADAALSDDLAPQPDLSGAPDLSSPRDGAPPIADLTIRSPDLAGVASPPTVRWLSAGGGTERAAGGRRLGLSIGGTPVVGRSASVGGRAIVFSPMATGSR